MDEKTSGDLFVYGKQLAHPPCGFSLQTIHPKENVQNNVTENVAS